MSGELEFSEQDLDTLGRLVDTLDNLTYSAKLPLPDKLHKEALLSHVETARDTIKEILVKNGFNPWSDE